MDSIGSCVKDKRREYRIPVSFPTAVSSLDRPLQAQGRLANINQLGARAIVESPQPFSYDEPVHLGMNVMLDEWETKAHVRWCQEIDDKTYAVGVEFADQLHMKLPIHDVASICKSLDQSSNPADQNGKHLLEKTVEHLCHQTVWGTLFWILASEAHTNFAHWGARLELSTIRLNRFLGPESRELQNKINKDSFIREVIEDLQQSTQYVKSISHLFAVFRDQTRRHRNEYTFSTDLDQLVPQEVQTFNNILHHLVPTHEIQSVKYRAGKLPMLCARPSDFAHGFRYLMILAYRTAVICDASSVYLSDEKTGNTFRLCFRHDGFRILKESNLEIHPMDPTFLEGLSAQDARNALFFHYGLLPLRHYDASIKIHSESGDNIIALNIPTRLFLASV